MGKQPFYALWKENTDEKTYFLFCPDKTHKNAVRRNKTKRILRELARKNEAFPFGIDVALVAGITFSNWNLEARDSAFQAIRKKIENEIARHSTHSTL